MNILCKIFGHFEEKIAPGVKRCRRCTEVTETENHEPVSELDEIIHDRNWYSPEKKD